MTRVYLPLMSHWFNNSTGLSGFRNRLVPATFWHWQCWRAVLPGLGVPLDDPGNDSSQVQC